MKEVDESDPPPVSMFRLCGLLWNCTDCVPTELRDDVRDRWQYPYADPREDPYSYAQAARLIRAVLSEDAAVE